MPGAFKTAIIGIKNIILKSGQAEKLLCCTLSVNNSKRFLGSKLNCKVTTVFSSLFRRWCALPAGEKETYLRLNRRAWREYKLQEANRQRAEQGLQPLQLPVKFHNEGDLNAEDLNAEDLNAEGLNAGDLNAGDLNAGDLNAGDLNAGDSCAFNAGSLSSAGGIFGEGEEPKAGRDSIVILGDSNSILGEATGLILGDFVVDVGEAVGDASIRELDADDTAPSGDSNVGGSGNGKPDVGDSQAECITDDVSGPGVSCSDDDDSDEEGALSTVRLLVALEDSIGLDSDAEEEDDSLDNDDIDENDEDGDQATMAEIFLEEKLGKN